jgi:pyruvate kinase
MQAIDTDLEQAAPVDPAVGCEAVDGMPPLPLTSRGERRNPRETASGATEDPRSVPSSNDLLNELLELRNDVSAEGRTLWRQWNARSGRGRFRVGALNLAHYLTLRHRDLRGLQDALMTYGLSSLGRLEGRVLANLDAVIGALAAMCGTMPAHHPRRRAFFRGERLLRANTDELFGPAAVGLSRPAILVTLPSEAASKVEFMIALLRNGANAVRINCAHDDPQSWAAMIRNLRAAETATGRRACVLADLAGPKVRIGRISVAPDRARLAIGDEFLLVAGPFAALDRFPVQATCEPAGIVQRLAEGDPVFLDDGKLSGIVERNVPEGVVVRVRHTGPKGFKLKPEKGLNVPMTELGLLALTDEDRHSLDFVAQHADLIGYSFVQSAADVRLLQEELAKRRPTDWARIGLIAKIETPVAVRNLPEIIVQAARHQPFGVMIARGDLAVEIGFERLAETQEEILWLCEAAHVPVIWATQVLESLVKKGIPTRGDMTDAAMSARAECVMLNKGPYVAEAVAMLDRLLVRMTQNQSKKTPKLRRLNSW